jgi:hypothetical protein
VEAKATYSESSGVGTSDGGWLVSMELGLGVVEQGVVRGALQDEMPRLCRRVWRRKAGRGGA